MMLRAESERRRILSASLSTKSALPSRGPVHERVLRRVREGCIIPSVSAVSKSALQALEDRVHQVLPHSLMGAKRSSALALAPDNGVPETLIVECAIADSAGAYMEQYRKAAKRALKDSGMSSAKASRKAVAQAYWDYLTDSNGVSGGGPNRDSSGGAKCGGKPEDQKKATAALLFYSTFGEKMLTKRPFKESAANAVYCKTRKDLCRAHDAVQRYAYYMRPDDPMNRSEDTAARLEELLQYVLMVYRCIIYFMDVTDAKALKAAGYVPGPYGPRETQTPDKLFVKYARTGPPLSPRGGMTALLRLTHDAMLCLIKLCSLCSSGEWRGKVGSGGISSCCEAALAVVDLITMAHHHCQYLLNLTLVGYACWLRGGINDPGILSAIRQQGRYCHFFGTLAPTATSHSWAAMEVGTEWWLKLAVANGIARYGGPTPHYLLTTDTGTYRGPRRNSRFDRRRPRSVVVGRNSERAADRNSAGALFLGDTGNNIINNSGTRGDGRYEHDFKWPDRSDWKRRSLRRAVKVSDISTARDDSDVTASDDRPFKQRSRSLRIPSRGRPSSTAAPSSSCGTTATMLFQESNTRSEFSGRSPPQLPPRNESLADRGRLRLIASAYNPTVRQCSQGLNSDSEYDSEDVEDDPERSDDPNDDEYWYANHPSQTDTCAFAGEPDPYDSFFGERDDEDLEFWPSGKDISGRGSGSDRSGGAAVVREGDGGDCCCDGEARYGCSEGENMYVSMEEIERTLAKQRSESRGYSERDEDCRYCNVMVGDADHRAPQQHHPSDYDIPRRRWDRCDYDVPSFPGSVSDEESEYDVPRKTAIPRVVSVINSHGVTVQYDVPKPITTLSTGTEKRKRQSV